MSIRDYLKLDDNIMQIEEGQEDEYLSNILESFFAFIDNYIDMDKLDENGFCLLQHILEMTENDWNKDEEIEEEVNEARGKKKKVVRGGKRTKKVQCRSGYKSVNGKCVRMSQSERRTRSKAQRKGAKKRRQGQSSSIQKRKRSMRKRS